MATVNKKKPTKGFKKGNKLSKGFRDGTPYSLPAGIHALRKKNITEFVEIIDSLLHLNINELDSIVQSEEVSVLTIWVANVIRTGVLQGAENKLEFILQRTVGKVPDQMKLNENKAPVVQFNFKEEVKNKIKRKNK